MLINQNFKIIYNTSEHNIIKDFNQLALANSNEYLRGVGYFTSGWLQDNSQGLSEFIHRGCKIKFITSPNIDKNDLNALLGDYNEDILEKVILNNVKEIEQNLQYETRNLLGWLIDDGLIEFKFAIPTKELSGGEFHDKFGIFIDQDKKYIAFNGSQNDSKKANKNYESISVFKSWGDETSTVLAKEILDRFNKLWDEQDENLKIYSMSDVVKKKLVRLKDYSKNPYNKPTASPEVNKWIHQEKAVDIFLKQERGLLNMATGTGKTRTALKALTELYNKGNINTVIVSTFGNSLLHQWYKEILKLRSSLRLKIYRHHASHREKQRYINDPANSALIISNSQLPAVLKNLSEEQGKKTLLIYDEVHRLGAPDNVKKLKGLSAHIRYVLGLSATPEREYDENGNKFIEEHIGPILMNFSLEDAIRKNILAPFRYFPLDYVASEEDKEKIKAVHSLKARRIHDGNPMSQEEFWTKLAQVYKSSRVKQQVFNEFIKTHLDLLSRCIIFVDTTEYALEVLEIVHKYRADFHTYLSGDDEDVLKRFADGGLECLVACHRLSEGIDIQSLNTVILFSSDRAKLETIQRIGRCLRSDPNNSEKIANVIDFIRYESITDGDRKLWLQETSKIKPIKD